ncbi:MAG: YggT family protein [Dehalococcoidia bacterium]|nr:YggT family protein [Dehalococcoidia bacterium]
MDLIKTFLELFIFVLIFAIFARSILSWFPIGNTNHPIVAIVYQITEPILGPLRRVVPRLGMFDLTPMIAIFILIFLSAAVSRL